MATKLYLTADWTPFPPSADQGGWDDSTGDRTARLDLAPGSVGPTLVQVAEANASNTWDVLLYRGISSSLTAGHTFGGTIQAMIGVMEANLAINAFYHVHAYVLAPDGSVRGTLLADYVETVTEEWPNGVSIGSVAGRAFASAQALAAVSAQAGDRVVIEVGFRAGNTSTSPMSGYLVCGGDASAADYAAGTAIAGGGRSFVTLSQDVPLADDHFGNWAKLYLTGAAAPATPPSDRGSWDDSGSDVTAALDAHPGWTTPAVVQATETSASNTWDALLYRGVSGELDGDQTIAGSLNAMIGMGQSAAATDFVFHVHAYVMKPDGTVRGTLLADYVEVLADEFTAGVTASTVDGEAFAAPQALSPVAALDGDRIVVEVGFRALNTATGGQIGALAYGGSPQYPDHTLHAPNTALSYLVFSQDIALGPTEAQVAQLVSQAVVSFATEAQVAQLVAMAVIANYDPEGAGEPPPSPPPPGNSSPGGKPGPGKGGGGGGKPNRPIIGVRDLRKLRIGVPE